MTTKADKPSVTREYWTHNVGEPAGPVAQFRMSQLIDYDKRVTEPARTVYRFLIGWYMQTRGDALASIRHIVATMRGRAPDGARHLSRSAVQRAIVLLMEKGWVVRTFVGKGRGGSRYVPVLNVLELATQGTLPSVELASFPLHRDAKESEKVSHATGTVVSHATGTQKAVASHHGGTKTRLPDPRTDAETGSVNVSADGGSAASAPAASSGFETAWKAYGRYGNKAAARTAFEAIDNPEVSHIAERAASWKASAKPGTKRMPFEKWLSLEKYDEADRQQASRPKPRKQPKAKMPEPVAPNVPADHNLPRGRCALEIHRAELVEEEKRTRLVIKYRDQDGRSFQQLITLESANKREQDEGQGILSKLLCAGELLEVEEPSELHWTIVIANVKSNGEVEFSTPTAEECKKFSDPDDLPEAA